MFNHLRGNRLIIYLSNVGDREHIKDTQSIIHRFCTNPLKPRTTFGAEQDDEHEGAFVEFQLGDVNGCWDLGVKCKTSDG